jgi:peptide/nickel transport system substrate-binding protein
VFYPYSLDSAKAHFANAGLADTDGNGFLNHPADVLGGADVQITLLNNADMSTDGNLAEAVVAMMEEAGIKVALNTLSSNDMDSVGLQGGWDWRIFRNGSDLITVVQNTEQLAPLGPQTMRTHFANAAGEIDLMPFEEELNTIISGFIATQDAAERVELMKQYQQVYTENVYGVGLTAYPGALIINKRFSNIPAGAPIFMYNWAEDNIYRERVFVAADAQQDYELHPDTIPGAPGSAGAVTAN